MKKSFLYTLFLLLGQMAMAQTNYNMQFRSQTQFPGQTLANICGYAKNGKEYALLGASKGMVIMNVTNPDAPQQIAQIPGPDNLWKEIKVYKDYAYVTSEGGQGLQIVDMRNLPSDSIPHTFYTGDGVLTNLGRIHALHIDTLKGVVYCFGSSGTITNGAIMLDVKTNPMSPKYIGAVAKDYIHDGYAHNDTLYAGHIYRGDMEIWYTGNKSNPISLGKVKTPTAFTHNIWLSENRKYAYTTDENNNSFLAAYDVSDPSNITLVDKIAHNLGSGAVVHNTHINNDYAVSSYYTEGVTIHDAHRPDNLVEVAHYDTYLDPINPADPFDGAWGVYPYLPSGNLIISNIGEGLFILTPTYKRACYVEGKVKDKVTGAALEGAEVKIAGVSTAGTISNIQGIYKTGVANAGNIVISVVKPGYKPASITVAVTHGDVTALDILLEPIQKFDFTTTVTGSNGVVIKDVTVSIVSTSQNTKLLTNTSGKTVFTTFPDTVTVYISKWGYLTIADKNVALTASKEKTYVLQSGYRDDFIGAAKFNWTESSTASAGVWVLDKPIATLYNGANATPANDNATDLGTECYLTGNAEGQPGASDVDNGFTKLTSPSMDLTTYANPTLRFMQWYFSGGGQGTPPNDSFYVTLSNGSTSRQIHIAKATNLNVWSKITLPLKNILPITNNMQVSFTAVDEDPGHLVKAAIDVFEIVELVNVEDMIDESIALRVAPNPSSGSFSVTYEMNTPIGEMRISNTQGQIMEQYQLSTSLNNINVGDNLPAGVYFLQIQTGSKMSRPMRLVKL